MLEASLLATKQENKQLHQNNEVLLEMVNSTNDQLNLTQAMIEDLNQNINGWQNYTQDLENMINQNELFIQLAITSHETQDLHDQFGR